MLRVRNGEQLERQIATSDGQEAAISFVHAGTAFTYSGGVVVGSAASGVFELVTSGEPNTSLYVTGARLKMTRSGVPSGMTGARLHWFTQLPSGVTDGAAFIVTSGDTTKYKGYSDLESAQDFGQTIFSQSQSLNKQITLSSSSLFVALTPTTTFASASGTPYRIEVDYFMV